MNKIKPFLMEIGMNDWETHAVDTLIQNATTHGVGGEVERILTALIQEAYRLGALNTLDQVEKVYKRHSYKF